MPVQKQEHRTRSTGSKRLPGFQGLSAWVAIKAPDLEWWGGDPSGAEPGVRSGRWRDRGRGLWFVTTLRPSGNAFHIHLVIQRRASRPDLKMPEMSKAAFDGLTARLSELTGTETEWIVDADFDYGKSGTSVIPLPIPMAALSPAGRSMEIRGLRLVLLAADKVEYQIIIDKPAGDLYHHIEFRWSGRLDGRMLDTLASRAEAISHGMVVERTVGDDATEG